MKGPAASSGVSDKINIAITSSGGKSKPSW
jgi:hypothetical protein